MQSEEDIIRAKRLAKMQQSVPSSSSSSTSSDPSSAPSSSSSLSSSSSSSSTPSSTPSKSTASTVMKTSTSSSSPVKSTPVRSSTSASTSSSSSTPSPMITSPSRATGNATEWEHQTISNVFRVSLQPSSANDVLYLDSLAAELLSESAPFLFKKDFAERILIDRFSNFAGEQMKVLPYIFGCFQRSDDEKRLLSKNAPPSRTELLNHIQDLLVSYTGIFLQYPDSLVQMPPHFDSLFNQFASHLVNEPDTSAGLPSLFMKAFIARYETDDVVETLIHPLLSSMSALMKKENIADAFHGHVSALVELVNSKYICNAITSHPKFVPEVENGEQFESESLLGPYFALSIFPDAKIYGRASNDSANPNVPAPMLIDNAAAAGSYVYSLFFSTPLGQLRAGDVQGTFASVRNTLLVLHDKLHFIMLQLLKHKEGREKTLDFLGRAIQLNAKRAQMRANFKIHSSDGFSVNLVEVLLRLSEKFIDPNNPMLSKIESGYLLHPDARVKVGDETKLAASSEEVSKWVDQRNYARQQAFANAQKKLEIDPATKITEFNPPNFITECFFMTIGAHHTGLISTINKYMQHLKHISDVKRSLEELEGARSEWQTTPMAPRYEAAIVKTKGMVDELLKQELAYESVLHDTATLSRSLQFYNFVALWLVKLVDPKGNGLPLPDTIPEAFASLPEYVVEDIADLLLFISRTVPQALDSVPLDDMIKFIIIFINSVAYIRNPYLRAKLVEVIAVLTPDMQGYRRRTSRFGEIIERHPLALSHLASSLMRFYVDVENTGSHTQFYDKFNIRYNIATIFKNLWSSPDHKAQFIQESKSGDYFVRFANMLMNDLTYLLDESLSKLAEIRDIELAKENPETWNAQAPEIRQTREQSFASAEKMVKTFLIFGKETLNLFLYFTEAAPYPFLRPELIDRLAGMLDYNLIKMAGPEAQKLKVKNAEKYSWNPRGLIVQLVRVFVNLSPIENNSPKMDFIVAVSKDGRSYKKDIFKNAVEILKKYSLVENEIIERFDHFIDLVEESLKSGQEEEEELGDIPEEYQDALMFTLMKDPVLLPSSKTVVDRSTIVSHLLSENFDPFNRSHLTIDMVIPMPELKQKIEDWVASKRAEKNTMK